jgi:hypothetical protein
VRLPQDSKRRPANFLLPAVREGCGRGADRELAARALAEGVPPEAVRQAALLAIGPPGLPRAVAAGTWVEDVVAGG